MARNRGIARDRATLAERAGVRVRVRRISGRDGDGTIEREAMMAQITVTYQEEQTIKAALRYWQMAIHGPAPHRTPEVDLLCRAFGTPPTSDEMDSMLKRWFGPD